MQNDLFLRALPSELPWSKQAYLLLDGVTVEALPRRLYEWHDDPAFEVLYLETHWAELKDLSPCLVTLQGPHDPALAAFLAQAEEEWGYLLFSDAERDDLLAHLRWLTSVLHPSGEEVLLRLADPAVAQALLKQSMDIGDATLFGPIEQVLAGDRLEERWHWPERPGPVAKTNRDKPYTLSSEQLERLGEVAFRGVLIRLDEHLSEHFPDHARPRQGHERWAYLQDLANSAYSKGFDSEHDITLFANIFGFLGEDALQTHPDIAALLASPSLVPAEHIEQAADLAYARATQAGRTS